MSIKEILAGGGGVLILMTLVQIAPIKVNPWSRIAGAIGRAINAEVSKRHTAKRTRIIQITVPFSLSKI